MISKYNNIYKVAFLNAFMGSFDEKISANKNNFNSKLIASVFKYQRKSDVKDFEDFKNAVINEIGDKMNKGGASSFISEENWIKLFEESETRDIISENVGEEKAKEMFGEMERGQIKVHKTDGLPTQIAVTTIKAPIISSKGYTNKKGKVISGYKRAKPVRFTSSQVKFLRVLKPRLSQRKITANQIITKFNSKYKEQQRPSSSITSKIYRI